MAMLAEPRRKKRYHLTPKGKPLFEDNDRFGTKMLEKMGWSKGKGLGKSETGTQDFVRVKFKSDERGLGFEDRDDQWTEHDKNFNGLLDNLNGNTNVCPDDCEIIQPSVGLGFATKSSNKKKLKDKISGQSLEENSKKSKARVHYKKFTKGKDMSQYSEKDLANIFGKKETPEDTNIYSQFQAFNAAGSESEAKEESEKESVQENPEKTNPIINTGVSINDYFKAKMAALKEKQGNVSSNPFDNNIRIINNVEVVIPSAKRKRSTDAEVSVVEEEEKIPRKKKKAKSLEDESIKQAPESGEIEEDHIPRKKKKNKNQSIKNDESDSVTRIGESGIIALEDVTEKEARREKKKSRKAIDVDDETNQYRPDSNSEESISSKKKKKKVSEEIVKNGEHIATPSIPAEEVPKKKKNKDKKKTLSVNDADPTENPSSIREETFVESRTQNIEETSMQKENIKSAKSKKNKTRNPTLTVEAEVSSHQKDFTSLTKEDNNYLLDTYTISSFCAEKFRNMEFHQFQGSNLMELNGYGLSTNLELDIRQIPADAERIIRLWNGTLDKYTHSTSKRRMYSAYIQKVKVARKSKDKIPSLKLKSLKRRHVFQCV